MYRTLGCAVSGLLLSATLAACGGEKDSAAGPSIRIGIGIDTAFAPVYLADQTGMFEDAGLDVEVVKFAQGGEGVDAMTSGEVQFAIAGDSTTLAKSGSGSIAIISGFQKEEGYIKLAVASDVEDPADIDKLGVVTGSVSDLCSHFLLKEYDLLDTVERVSATPPDLPPLLKRGDIDGFIFPEPWPAKAVEEADAKILSESRDFGCSPQLVLSSNTEWLEANGEVAQDFLAVLSEAADTVEADRETALKNTVESTRLPEDQVSSGLDEMTFDVRQLTDDDMASMADIAKWLETSELVSDPVDLDAVVKPDYYEE